MADNTERKEPSGAERPGHAKQNGASEQELIEAIAHLAFYAGWPQAMAAMAVAKHVFRGKE